jgi:hypothetical protein
MLKGRQQIAIKQEALAGTVETLAAADVVMHTGVAEYDAGGVEMVPREAMTSSLSPRGSVVGVQVGTIRWKQYLRGSYNHSTGALAAVAAGSTEADFHVPMLGCGLASTISGGAGSEQNSYSPSSTTISDETTGAYCTVALFEDGKRYRIIGAQGNCKLTFTVGQPVLAEFEFTGRTTAPTDTALLSPVYPTFAEPAFLGASLSIIGSYAAAKIRTLTLDFGNEISIRPDPNQATGVFTAQIVRRRPVGTLDPEEVLAATNNFWGQWLAGTTGAITTGTFGGNNNNQFSLTIPVAAYTRVGLGDRDGVSNAPLEFECRASAATGDDEFTLVQT